MRTKFRIGSSGKPQVEMAVYAIACTGIASALAAILLSPPGLVRTRTSQVLAVAGETGCRLGDPSCRVLSAETRTAAPARTPSPFGHLEFDWDADSADGIPGFGPLPPSGRTTYAKAAKERLSVPVTLSAAR